MLARRGASFTSSSPACVKLLQRAVERGFPFASQSPSRQATPSWSRCEIKSAMNQSMIQSYVWLIDWLMVAWLIDWLIDPIDAIDPCDCV